MNEKYNNLLPQYAQLAKHVDELLLAHNYGTLLNGTILNNNFYRVTYEDEHRWILVGHMIYRPQYLHIGDLSALLNDMKANYISTHVIAHSCHTKLPPWNDAKLYYVDPEEFNDNNIMAAVDILRDCGMVHVKSPLERTWSAKLKSKLASIIALLA